MNIYIKILLMIVLVIITGPLGIIGIIIYYLISKSNHRNKIQELQNQVLYTPGFYYQYASENTGMSFNVDEGKVLLQNYERFCIYDRTSIRDVNWEIAGWQYMHFYGSVAAIPHNIISKAMAKNKAKKKIAASHSR